MGKLTFLEFRNRAQKEHEKTMKMEWNSDNAVLTPIKCLKTQCLLNAFSTLQKVMFSNWKTLLLAKSKTRSANIVFLNENGVEFCQNAILTPIKCLKTQCLLNPIADLRDIEFRNRETYF